MVSCFVEKLRLPLAGQEEIEQKNQKREKVGRQGREKKEKKEKEKKEKKEKKVKARFGNEKKGRKAFESATSAGLCWHTCYHVATG